MGFRRISPESHMSDPLDQEAHIVRWHVADWQWPVRMTVLMRVQMLGLLAVAWLQEAHLDGTTYGPF